MENITAAASSSVSNAKTFHVSVIVGLAVIFAFFALLIILSQFCSSCATPEQTQQRIHTQTEEKKGLDKQILDSLPGFTYCKSDKNLECAVCLSEFEEGETGRRLPACGHSFHMECIDMWFYSHSTCPICRASAPGKSVPKQSLEQNQLPQSATVSDIVITVVESGSASVEVGLAKIEVEEQSPSSSSLAALKELRRFLSSGRRPPNV